MLTIGLTGGVGAGKDEAAKIFKRFGVKVIDADDVGHKLLKRSSPAYKKISKMFGLRILDSKKEIERKKLGEIVFGNRRKLKLLNRIIHPLMEKEFKKEIAKQREKGSKFVVLNAAVLFELGWDKLVDKTILITAPEELRIKRLQDRGISRERALAMVSSQWSDERKKKKADFVIENNGSIAELKKKITDIRQLILTKGDGSIFHQRWNKRSQVRYK